MNWREQRTLPMKLMKTHKYQLLVLCTLAFGSALSVAMLFARRIYTGQPHFIFLAWNLFLAWLPLLLAIAAVRLQQRPLLLLFCSFLWLIFLPNSPYLVTDLMHLSWRDHAPLWFDVIMLFSFAITGLMLGFTSLYLMHTLIRRFSNWVVGWIFVAFALALSSFGVYVGRFLRWNSWDILFNPTGILVDVLDIALNPHLHLRTFVVWFLLMTVFMFMYVALVSLPHAAVEHERA